MVMEQIALTVYNVYQGLKHHNHSPFKLILYIIHFKIQTFKTLMLF